MRNTHKALGLLLLLLMAQQGAVIHELSHFSNRSQVQLKVGSSGAVDTTCALCPAFAQAASPAFSHSLQIPRAVRLASQLIPEPRCAVAESAVPRPRSRGPPSLS